jgi:acyl dehydratase
MEVCSKFVGAKMRTATQSVSLRSAMNFAASLFDNNSSYFDDERVDGVIAHPMMCTALTWPSSLNIGEYLIAEEFPAHLNKMQVHYTETIHWHTPMRPGMTLAIAGEMLAILPHPAGTHMMIKYDAWDEREQHIFTEYTGAILRGVKCVPEGKGRESMPMVPQYKPDSAPLWSATVHVDPLAPYIYDGCADISFPIHSSAKFAHSVGLPGIILHGTATVGYAVRELVNREAGGDPATLTSMSCRFTDMVFPGTDISVSLLGKNETDTGADLFFAVLNANGKKAVSGGHIHIRR